MQSMGRHWDRIVSVSQIDCRHNREAFRDCNIYLTTENIQSVPRDKDFVLQRLVRSGLRDRWLYLGGIHVDA